MEGHIPIHLETWFKEVLIGVASSIISLVLFFSIKTIVKISRHVAKVTTNSGTEYVFKWINMSRCDILDVHQILMHYEPHHVFERGGVAYATGPLDVVQLPQVPGRTLWTGRGESVVFRNVRLWQLKTDPSSCWNNLGCVELTVMVRHALSGRTVCKSFKYHLSEAVKDGVFCDEDDLTVRPVASSQHGTQIC
jgi:hypothetical protein